MLSDGRATGLCLDHMSEARFQEFTALATKSQLALSYNFHPGHSLAAAGGQGVIHLLGKRTSTSYGRFLDVLRPRI